MLPCRPPPSPPSPPPAVEQWVALGSDALSDSAPSVLQAGASASGKPFVLVSDSGSGTRVLEWSGSGWAALGSSLAGAQQASLAVGANASTYIAYTAAEQPLLRVAQLVGSQWQAVDGTGLPDGAATALTLQVAADGTLFLACSLDEGTAVFSRASSDGSWQQLPALAFEAGTPMRLSAAGRPLLVGIDDGSSQLCVMGLTAGGAWAAVGSCAPLADASSTSLAITPAGTVLLALSDEVAGATRVLQLNGSSWSALGSDLAVGDDATACQLVAPADSLLVVGCLVASSQPAVLQYSGQQWAAVPSTGLPSGPGLLQLAVAGDGTLVATYSDSTGAVRAERYSQQ